MHEFKKEGKVCDNRLAKFQPIQLPLTLHMIK